MNQLAAPRYRVSISIEATAVDTSVLFEGAKELDSPQQQVAHAISYARTVHASRDDIKVTRVMRQEREDGPWYEVVSAFRATPGTKVEVPRIAHGGLQRAENHYYEGVEWVTVVRWEGAGDGTAWLVGDLGHRSGPYTRDHIFRTR